MSPRQGKAAVILLQIRLTAHNPSKVFHTYLKETFLNFMGSSVLKNISEH